MHIEMHMRSPMVHVARIDLRGLKKESNAKLPLGDSFNPTADLHLGLFQTRIDPVYVFKTRLVARAALKAKRNQLLISNWIEQEPDADAP